MADRPAAASVLLVGVLLAGCLSGDAGAQARAEGGAIRGVVVDDAIRPLENATVTARGPDGTVAVTASDAAGAFAFDGLAPGAWLVSAEKVAHAAAQQTVQVESGTRDLPIVRLLLRFLPDQAPFFQEFKMDGFAECILLGANLCFILNFYPCLVAETVGQPCPENLTSDRSFLFVYGPIVSLGRVPDWAQMELAWESTQAVTDWLTVRASAHSPDDGATIDRRMANATGPSPILFSLDAATSQDWELGTREGLAFEVFSGGSRETCTGLPAALGCTGLVLNQELAFFFHLFYGYQPPSGWRFSEAGEAPPPP